MPRYSLSQLLARGAAGNIGRRGIRRLESAGLAVDPRWSGGQADVGWDKGALMGAVLPTAPIDPAADPEAAVNYTKGLGAANEVSASQPWKASDDLGARRQVLYGKAVQAAQSGQPLSEGLKRRLSLGAGGGPSLLPHTAAEVKGLGDNNVNSLLDTIRKRRAAIHSNAGIYH